jgi:hypothetical protein
MCALEFRVALTDSLPTALTATEAELAPWTLGTGDLDPLFSYRASEIENDDPPIIKRGSERQADEGGYGAKGLDGQRKVRAHRQASRVRTYALRHSRKAYIRWSRPRRLSTWRRQRGPHQPT